MHIADKREFDLVKREGALLTFKLEYVLEQGGIYKYAFRMFPKNADLPHRMDFCYVRWLQRTKLKQNANSPNFRSGSFGSVKFLTKTAFMFCESRF